jgi:hypothetical protein
MAAEDDHAVVQNAPEKADPALKSMSKYKRGHNVDVKVSHLLFSRP